MTTLIKGLNANGKQISSTLISNNLLIEWCANMQGLRCESSYGKTGTILTIENLTSVGSLNSFKIWLETGEYPTTICKEQTDIPALADYFGIRVDDIVIEKNSAPFDSKEIENDVDEEDENYEYEETIEDKEYLNFHQEHDPFADFDDFAGFENEGTPDLPWEHYDDSE